MEVCACSLLVTDNSELFCYIEMISMGITLKWWPMGRWQKEQFIPFVSANYFLA